MRSWVRRIVDSQVPGSLASQFRLRRLAVFEDLVMALPSPVRILDVGGTLDYWRANFPDVASRGWHITLLNLRESAVVESPFTATRGDGRDLEFPDDAFDVVHSNSVIEHVGGLDDQRRMADEVRRVGVHHYVQTPNRWFPIEPHFLFPMFQFMPVELRVQLLRRFDLGWYRRIPDPDEARRHVLSHRLLGEKDMRTLFPTSRIVRERVAGLTKSLVAVA